MTSGQRGVLVEVNAETDFVGRNHKFQEFAVKTSEVYMKSGGDIESLKKQSYAGSSRTVEEELVELVAVIGENLTMRRCLLLEVQQGVVASYIHSAISSNLGRIGVLVALESTGDKEKLLSLGRQIAMHVAAAHPQSCFVEDLDPAILERERNIFTEQAKESGKPAEFIDKMIEGRLRKFYEEAVLSEQIFLIDDTKRKVSKVVEEASKDVGAPVKLKAFACFRLGEGIEKEEKDFAKEVAEQLSK
jgi:elongation factor Ts